MRESELYGGVLSASLSREYLALTTEFLRGDECVSLPNRISSHLPRKPRAFFSSLLTSILTTTKFLPHEYSEYVLPVVRDESTLASQVSSTVAIEAAHALAFRTGLGAPLLAGPHTPVSLDSVKAFASSAFTSGNVAVIGTGIDSARLAELVDKALAETPLPSGSSSTSTPSKYFGGATRIDSHSGPHQTVFVGFGTTTPSSALAVLANHLAPSPALKWPSAPPSSTTLTPVYLPYSDAVLTGVLVQGPDTSSVKDAAKTLVDRLKKPLTAEELKSAVARTKFDAAASIEKRESLILTIGQKVGVHQMYFSGFI